MGHTDPPWYEMGGDDTRCDSQEVEVSGGPHGAQLPHGLTPTRDGSQFSIEIFVCLLSIMCRRNILPDLNISCTFHKTQNPLCPIFRLGDIFRETGDNFSEMAIQVGGAFVP